MTPQPHRSRSPGRWVEFYAPYFPTPQDAEKFVAACRAQTPEAGAAKEIMEHGRRLTLLADGIAATRPGRDALPLLFLVICAEHASKRVHDAKKGQSAHHVRTFFENFLSESEKALLKGAFTTADGEPVDLPAAVGILYQVRCKVAHEGIYWEFAFNGPRPRADRKPPVCANLSLKQFRSMVVRGCIRAAKAKLDPEWAPVPVASIADPAEHDGQQADWGTQRALHRKYRRTPFVPKCPEIEFSAEDWALLRKEGSWLEALSTGAIAPLTPAQQEFVEFCGGGRAPAGRYEQIWDTYEMYAAFYSLSRPANSWTEAWPDDWDDEDEDYDEDRDLLEAELDSDAEAWAVTHDTGWGPDDDEEEEYGSYDDEDDDDEDVYEDDDEYDDDEDGY